jgi:hypothetical protein
MALYGVLQAVDGVGLKQAVNAWASAADGDKAVRFAGAETVRWLEWAVRSYQGFVFGLALLLFGAVIAVTGRSRARSATSWHSPAFVTWHRDGSSAAAVSRSRTRTPPSSESA